MASEATRPWHWILQHMADEEETNMRILGALVSDLPDFWTYASDNLRERIALKYLEYCSGFGRRQPSTSGAGPGIDLKRSCEEVLCSLARSRREEVVTSASLEKSGAEFSRHNLHWFILQKRAALPKSSPGPLNEFLARSGQVDYLQRNNGGEYEQGNKLKPSTRNGESYSQIQDSVAPRDPGSSIVNLQEVPSGSEKHLHQENVSDVDTRNHVHEATSNGGTGVLLLGKGSAPQLHTEKNTSSIGRDIQSLNLAAAPALDSGSLSLQDPSASRQHLFEQIISDCERRNTVQLLKRSPPPQPSCEENPSPQHAHPKRSINDINQPLCENDHSDVERCIIPETPSDNDSSDDAFSISDPNDEMFISEKHQLQDSQIHANPDSVGDWSEQGVCMKCDKGGQMLTCSTRCCFIAVHESCLGLSVNFKENGLFYCPFCSCTRATAAYRKAKTNVLRAGKTLSAFIDRDSVQGHLQKLSPAGNPGETNQAVVTGHMDHQHGILPHEYHLNKPDESPLKAKEQHQRGDANVCCDGNLSSRYSEAPPSVERYSGSHNAAEVNNDAMVNDHQGNDDVEQGLNGAATTTNNDKFPCGNKVTAPTCEKDDDTLINRMGEVGHGREFNGLTEHGHLAQPDTTTDTGNFPHEVTDAYHIRYSDASRAQEKDALGYVNDCAPIETLINQEQIRASLDHDTRRETSISLLSKRSTKERYDGAIGKTHPAQETLENTNVTMRVKLSGSSREYVVLKNQEQVRASPDHVDDREALNSQPTEKPAKRKRHAATIGKINDPRENVVNLKKEKFSSRRSRKDVSQWKRYFTQQVKLGRRRRLFWTSKEEDFLMDAMRKFSIDSDGTYPWKKIVESGHNVFDKTRQPGDLKDKWRNIKNIKDKQEM